MIKILPSNNQSFHLTESIQQKKMVFGFVNKIDDKTYHQLHQDFKCRDYLGDCVWGQATQQSITIYGFTFDPKKDRLDQDATRLVVHNASVYLPENVVAGLHPIETALGIKLTTVIPAEKGSFVIEGDLFWMKTILFISYYSFILKCLSYKLKTPENWVNEISGMNTNEASYLRRISPEVFKTSFSLLSEMPITTVSGWSKEETSDFIHNYSGFCCLLYNGNLYSRLVRNSYQDYLVPKLYAASNLGTK